MYRSQVLGLFAVPLLLAAYSKTDLLQTTHGFCRQAVHSTARRAVEGLSGSVLGKLIAMASNLEADRLQGIIR